MSPIARALLIPPSRRLNDYDLGFWIPDGLARSRPLSQPFRRVLFSYKSGLFDEFFTPPLAPSAASQSKIQNLKSKIVLSARIHRDATLGVAGRLG